MDAQPPQFAYKPDDPVQALSNGAVRSAWKCSGCGTEMQFQQDGLFTRCTVDGSMLPEPQWLFVRDASNG